MFEVDPSVRVAPDEDGEEDGADGRGDQHHEETFEDRGRPVSGGPARSIQGVVVESEDKLVDVGKQMQQEKWR